MRDVRRWVDREDDQASADRQTSSLAALAVTLLIIVVSLLLVRELRSSAAIEDCLVSGRTDCAEFVATP